MTPSSGGQAPERPTGSRRLITRLLQVVAALCVGVLVWTVAFRPDDGPPPVVPDQGVGQGPGQGDTEVVATTDVGVVYVVELQAPPNHRIMRLDTATGETTTTLPLTEQTAVYAMAASPAGDELAVAYTTDTTSLGNGLYRLDLADGSAVPVQVVPEVEGRYFTDLAYDTNGVLWATQAERTEPGTGTGNTGERLSIVSIDLEAGTLTTAVGDAVNPAPGDGWLAYLPVEADGARRSVGWLRVPGVPGVDGPTEPAEPTEVLDGGHDLDHLAYDPVGGHVLVAALLAPGEPLLTIGTPAGAHGNHLLPSQWLAIDPTSGDVSEPLTSEGVVVWDAAALPSGTLAYTTGNGLLVLGSGAPSMLVESGALRMIAG